MAEMRLSFKEMCARFDVTPRTLRYYEYIELLAPEREGRSRFYGNTEIARMTLILRGRRWGFSLEELRQWLLIYSEEGSEKQLDTFMEHASLKVAELREKEVELRGIIDELEDLVDGLKKDKAYAKEALSKSAR
ncbi:MAG: MerR family transcriptional regulator [Pseudomonadota bacterium]